MKPDDFAHQVYAALCVAKKGAPVWGEQQVKDVLRGEYEKAKGEWEAQQKARKRAAIDDRAQAIFNLYPRREGGSAALKSISRAIAEDGFELVLGKTTEYAGAVARWPRSYRYSQTKPGEPSRDLVPMATTFFNQNRYRDDSANWVRVGGSPAPTPKQNLIEPPLWRETFPDYIHVHRSWASIDAASQAYIVQQMQTKAHTA